MLSVSDMLATLKEQKKAGRLDFLLVHLDSFYNLSYSYFNMGLLSIATLLKEKGFSVKCLDSLTYLYFPPDEFEKFIRNSSPVLVGFYTISDNIEAVRHLAAHIKEISPGSRVVLGGPLATIEGADFLRFPEIDITVAGEGEIPALALAQYFCRSQGAIEEIPGVSFRQEGGIFRNPPAPFIENLDALPWPDYSLLGGVKYSFHIVSGRGCPYHCSFCFQAVHGSRYRTRSPENVVGEITANLEKYSVSAFEIVDDTFVADPGRAAEIARLLIEYRKRAPRPFVFYCEGRVNVLNSHPELVPLLREAGMVRMQIGIESGDPDTLKKYHKGFTVEEVEEAITLLARENIPSICGNFILGGPGESEDSFRRSLDLAKKLLHLAPGILELSSSFLSPYPATDIVENPGRYGLRIVEKDFRSGLSLSDCLIESGDLNQNDIRRLQGLFQKEILAEMRKMAPSLSPERVRQHFELARKFKTFTFWLQFILSGLEAVENYLSLSESPRFGTLVRAGDGDPGSWIPMRTVEKLTYSSDGTEIMLTGSYRRQSLKDEVEKLVYRLSAGKLSFREIAGEIKKRLLPELSADEIIWDRMLPLYRKLEKSFHVIFYTHRT
jgi:radical SAM superfamily enzyme YgiQ (UPF0313 family)